MRVLILIATFLMTTLAGADEMPVAPMAPEAQTTILGPATPATDSVATELPTESAAEADAPSRWGFTFGVGGDLQWRREVNPDYGNFRQTPQVFGNVRFARWSLQLEGALDGERGTSAGAFRVRTSTMTFGSWARFDVRDWQGYRPFVSLGGGAHFDRVSTEFQDKVDQRAGSRRFLGLGAGINKVFWSHLFGEVEGRVTSEELGRGPQLALVLRLGVTF